MSRENSTAAITIFCIFCFEAFARGLDCLDDVSNNRLKIHISRPTPKISPYIIFLSSAKLLAKNITASTNGNIIYARYLKTL